MSDDTALNVRLAKVVGKLMIAAGIVGLVVLSPLAISAGTAPQDHATDGSASDSDWDELRDAAQSQSGDRTVSEYASPVTDRWRTFGSLLVEKALYAIPITSLLMIFGGFGVLEQAAVRERTLDRVGTDG